MESKMIVNLIEDSEGEMILPLGDEICSEMGLKVGDSVEWIDNGDGSWTIKKKETELVLVETISTFRHRYVVEVPKGKSEWALDTVVCEEAKEMSQEHIGEQIVSHRVVGDEEALYLARQDNDFIDGKFGNRWSDEVVRKNFFTTLEKDSK